MGKNKQPNAQRGSVSKPASDAVKGIAVEPPTEFDEPEPENCLLSADGRDGYPYTQRCSRCDLLRPMTAFSIDKDRLVCNTCAGHSPAHVKRLQDYKARADQMRGMLQKASKGQLHMEGISAYADRLAYRGGGMEGLADWMMDQIYMSAVEADDGRCNRRVPLEYGKWLANFLLEVSRELGKDQKPVDGMSDEELDAEIDRRLMEAARKLLNAEDSVPVESREAPE